MPPADPAGVYAVQPVGCASPTFTGTAAELDTIAAHAARVAIELLSGGDGFEDLATAALRDDMGRPQAASWWSAPLTRHPDCPRHPAVLTDAA
jgi:hypothetical protein